MSLDSFKRFVRNKPLLADYVKSGKESWQSLYNLYDLYGENNSVWDSYLNSPNVTLKDLFDSIKNIDVTEVQNSINSLQKGIGYLEDLVKSKEKSIPIRKSNYESRPLYKYYDD